MAKKNDMTNAVKMMAGMASNASQTQERTLQVLRKNFESLIDNQNEHTLALATIYDLLVEVAKKQGVSIPKPHISMTVEKGD
ncbi:MAG: hypothetical protein QXR60_03800 [Candidatus Nanoarchaeia archaeon]